LTPSKVADATLPNKKKIKNTKGGQKDKKPSNSVSVVIATPISKPKINNKSKKKKTQNGSKLFSKAMKMFDKKKNNGI